MQDCAGGLISRPEHLQAMVNTLSRYSPQDIASLRERRSQHRIEIEARYTAKLPPQQVMQLFDRYCSGPEGQGYTTAGFSKRVTAAVESICPGHRRGTQFTFHTFKLDIEGLREGDNCVQLNDCLVEQITFSLEAKTAKTLANAR